MAKAQSGFLRRELWSPPRLQRPIMRDRRLLRPSRPSLVPSVGSLHHPARRALLHGPLPVSQEPWQYGYLVGGTLPANFADFSTEGMSNHYFYGGVARAGASAWLTAAGGSYANATTKRYRVNSSGILASATANALRFDYDPAALTLKGLLLEGASTNLIYNSQNLGGANWASDYNVTFTENTGTAPDGTSTDNLVVPSASSTYHGFLETSFTGASGAWTHSVYVKPSGATTYYICFRADDTGAVVSFNLSGSGSVIGTGTGWANASIIKLSDGHFRISAEYTGGSGSSVVQWFLLPSTYASGDPLSGGNQFAGDGSSGVYVWGFQTEQLPFATSYIPTTSASAMRAADNLELPWTSATATFRIKSINQVYASGKSVGLLTADTNSNGDVLAGMGSATNLATIDSAATLALSSAVSSWGSSNVSGVAGNASGRVLGANNVSPTSDGNPLFTATPSDLWIGGENATPSYGNIVQFGAWSIAASSGQLQAMTNTP